MKSIKYLVGLYGSIVVSILFMVTSGANASVVYASHPGLTIPQNTSVTVGDLNLTMQGDGNLVLHQGSTVIWASGSQSDCANTCKAVFQDDGNLVVSDGSTSLWSTQTGGHTSPTQLILSATASHLEIQDATQDILWVSSYPLNRLTLTEGKFIDIGTLKLVMQTDGNLVLQEGSTVLWASGTGSATNCATHQCQALFQTDGNLVVYDGSTSLWSSKTGNNPGALLVFSTKAPYLEVRDTHQDILWASSYSFSDLTLSQGQFIDFGGLHLRMQKDGNLVLYQAGSIKLWSSGTGSPTNCETNQCRAVFQLDGNLVVFDGSTSIWSTETGKNPGAELVLSATSAQICILNENSILWSTKATDLKNLPRISTKTLAVNNQGVFYNETSGSVFVPRGMDYIRMATVSVNGSTEQQGSAFDPSYYSSSRVQSDLEAIAASGYNFVRVFITDGCLTDAPSNLCYPQVKNSSGQLVPGAPGILPEYLNNVLDFVERARSLGIYVLPTGSFLPANYNVGSAVPNVTGKNAILLNPTYSQSEVQFWQDFLNGLNADDPTLLSSNVIWGIDVFNQVTVEVTEEPFSLTGPVSFGGVTYNMSDYGSDASSRQQLLDTASVNWINPIVAGIKAVDPHILVTTTLWTPYSHGRPGGFDGVEGLCTPTTPSSVPCVQLNNFHYTLRPEVLMRSSNADFISLQLYHTPTIPPFDFNANMNSAGISAQSVWPKPILVAEYGASQKHFPTVQLAGAMEQDLLAQSCEYGITGWAMWTWNTTEQPDRWTAIDDNGYLNNLFSPAQNPLACAPIPAGEFVVNSKVYRSNGASYCVLRVQPSSLVGLTSYPRLPSLMPYDGDCAP